MSLSPEMFMSDSNDPKDVLREHDHNSPLLRELHELRAYKDKHETANVVHAPFAGEVPRYKLNEPAFLDNTFIEAGSVIEFTDYPNLSMVPQNEAAERRLQEHIEYLSEHQRAREEGQGRVFTGLITDRGVMIAQNMQDARREARGPTLSMPEEKGVVPAMPHTEEARALDKRRPGRPRKLMSHTPPPSLARGRQSEVPTVGPTSEPKIFGERTGT